MLLANLEALAGCWPYNTYNGHSPLGIETLPSPGLCIMLCAEVICLTFVETSPQHIKPACNSKPDLTIFCDIPDFI